jgi:hypothetical protein
VFVHDADGSRRVETIIGTAPARSYRQLPALALESELALARGLMADKHLRNPPQCNLLANVVGGPMKERVLVYGPYLVVLGWDYRNGTEYYFRDVGRAPRQRGVPRCELAELTGDGLADIVVRKRLTKSKQDVEILEVLSFDGAGDTPQSVFAQEVRFASGRASIDDSVQLAPAGRRSRITVRAGPARGVTARTFERAFRTDAKPLLLPWDSVSERTFGWRGGEFVQVHEGRRQGGAGRPAGNTSSRSAGRAGSDTDSVYALYRRERGVSGRARFDLQANLVGDRKPERVVLHDRDLVAFGPGFRNGQGYAAVTLTPFADGRDITSVQTQDVTGDGRSEIVVTGLMHATAPAEAGGGEVVREVVLIYKLASDGLQRIFAAELERRMGHNKIVGSIRYGKGTIELRPGRAVGFTEQTYPFAQEVGSSGGFEPLLLPWSGARPVRYRYDGSQFRP